MAGFADRLAAMKGAQEGAEQKKAAEKAAAEKASADAARAEKASELAKSREAVTAELGQAEQTASEAAEAVKQAEEFEASQGENLDAAAKAEIAGIKQEAGEVARRFDELKQEVQRIDAEIAALEIGGGKPTVEAVVEISVPSPEPAAAEVLTAVEATESAATPEPATETPLAAKVEAGSVQMEKPQDALAIIKSFSQEKYEDISDPEAKMKQLKQLREDFLVKANAQLEDSLTKDPDEGYKLMKDAMKMNVPDQIEDQVKKYAAKQQNVDADGWKQGLTYQEEKKTNEQQKFSLKEVQEVMRKIDLVGKVRARKYPKDGWRPVDALTELSEEIESSHSGYAHLSEKLTPETVKPLEDMRDKILKMPGYGGDGREKDYLSKINRWIERAKKP